MQKKLTKLQAYNVMLSFLEKIYEQEKSDYLGDILSNSEFWSDGLTSDRGSWSDWKKAIVVTMSQDKKLRNHNKLTMQQACNVMCNYVKNYVSFYNPKPDYLIYLLHELQQVACQQNVLWQDWVQIADVIIKQKDPRVYLEFVK